MVKKLIFAGAFFFATSPALADEIIPGPQYVEGMEYVLVHQSMNDTPVEFPHKFVGVSSEGAYNFGGRLVSKTLENIPRNRRNFSGLALASFPLKITGNKLVSWQSTAKWTSRNCDFEEKLEVDADKSDASASMVFNGEKLRIVKIMLEGESSSACYQSSDVIRSCSYSPKFGLCMEETFERHYGGSKQNSWKRHVKSVSVPAKT